MISTRILALTGLPVWSVAGLNFHFLTAFTAFPQTYSPGPRCLVDVTRVRSPVFQNRDPKHSSAG